MSPAPTNRRKYKDFVNKWKNDKVMTKKYHNSKLNRETNEYESTAEKTNKRSKTKGTYSLHISPNRISSTYSQVYGNSISKPVESDTEEEIPDELENNEATKRKTNSNFIYKRENASQKKIHSNYSSSSSKLKKNKANIVRK